MNSLRRASRAFLVVVLAVLTLTLGACRRRERLPSGTTTSTATYLVGEKVDVEWNGSWWKAEIVGVNGSLYRVHYTGWSAKWDEDVTTARIRPPTGDGRIGTEVPGVADQASPSKWKVGDNVDVSWNGSWWAASIIGVNGNLYRVHYTGWASSWDENVTLARIRPATPGAKRGTGK
ncbi:MAG: agenet domain-containing protein [Labilithrix sp.]